MHTGPNVDPRWNLLPTFAVSLEESTHSPAEMGVVPRFRHTLLEHINHCETNGMRPLSFPDAGDLAADALSTFNPGQPVAFVTLYTHEIAMYGRIAERNFRQYCDRHGYTLYLHRDIPPDAGVSGTGNWLKPWLLHTYLAHHEWIIWLDADILIIDQAKKIEPFLKNRDRLVARDVGQWPINSGMMGFRRTEANASALVSLMQTIGSLADRSSVYAGNGDQFYFISALRERGLLDEETVLSPIVINTPWFFRDHASFAVHYFGMWPEMRALMMDRDERTRLDGPH